MKRLLLASAVAAGTMLGMAGQASASCGTVSIAEMNWATAQLMANVDKVILQEGYGCEVEIVPGDTMPTFTSMNEKGQPDVAGELWINAVAVPLAKAVGEGRLHKVSDGPISGLGEGWWLLPHTMSKHPELKTVLDVIERPDLFPHPEDSSKGGFHNCPSGWGCQLANINLFRAFDMEKKGWRLIDPGSAAGLDASVAKYGDRKENWFGYYWTPTSLAGKYGMTMLEFGVPFAGKENWDGCIVKPEQECANPKPSAWTKSEVHTVITDSFKKRSALAGEYFAKRIFPAPVMNKMLVFMANEQASGEDAALEFLAKHESIWTKWVSPDVVKKVKASM